MKPQYVTTADLAEFFKVTKMGISFWVKEGMPRIGSNKFDLWEVMQWHLTRIENRMDIAVQESNSETDKIRKTRIEADLKQLELDQQLGKIIEMDVAINELSKVMSIVRNTITSLPNKIAPQIVGKSLKEIKLKLQKELNESVRAIDFSRYYEPEKNKKPVIKRKRKV